MNTSTQIHFTRTQMAKIAYGATRDQLDLIGNWFPGVGVCNFIDAIHAALKAYVRGAVTVNVEATSVGHE